jgi:hypothetical protein
MKLIDHRKVIEGNPEAYMKELEDDRLVKTMISHIKPDFPDTQLA